MPSPLEILHAAVAKHNQGDLSGAAALYRAVLKAEPRQFDAMHLLGVIHLQQGKADQAVRELAKAAALRPQSPEVQHNLGLAYLAAGHAASALTAFDAVLALASGSADAWTGRGRALAMSGQHDKAIAAFDRALAIAPRDVVALNDRGGSLAAERRFQEAVASWKAAAAIVPRDAATLTNLATALAALNQHDEAVDYFRKAIAIAPTAEAYVGCAVSLATLMRYEEALAAFDQAIARRPKVAEFHYRRAHVLDTLGRQDDSAAAYQRAIAIDPAYLPARAELALTRRTRCMWDGAEPWAPSLAALEKAPPMPPFALVVLSDDPAVQLRNAQRFVAPFVGSAPAAPVAYDGTRKIRLAYLSADYRTHPVAFLVAELIERHDRGRFDVIGLSLGPPDATPVRKRLEAAFDSFRDLRTAGDADVAGWLKDNRIDIAIDLTGHCQGGRPGIMAFRGAPVQVNYLGFPGTIGASFVDYIIADPFLIPPEHEARFTEKIARLPQCYQATDTRRPMPQDVPPRAAVGLPEQGFVFCCFNSVMKITPDLWEVWMRLLSRAPDSVLWLLCDNPAAQGNLAAAAKARGVDPARIVFAPRVPNDAHIARMRAADLFLDTLPYNAHTTASDALWAGLPLVTCVGETFAARVGGSILRAAGLPELVTSTLVDYERLAAEIAAAPHYLRDLKAKVDASRTSAPLFDSARFARNIEAAYRAMMARAGGGLPPESFTLREP